MNLNVLLRGQSNAALLGQIHANEIISLTQALLGFDGVNDRVSLEFAYDRPGSATAYGGTSFLNQWLSRSPTGDWQVGPLEQSLLNFINAIPAAQKAEPTAVVWLHSESDSTIGSLTPAIWESAVRYDAAVVRQAFGKPAEQLPYLFVSAIPFPVGTATGHQAIRIGMENLAADPAFNGGIAARALDTDMSFDDRDRNPATPDYGGWHQGYQDAQVTAQRIAFSLAQEWAAYARPGSPVALSGGQADDLGPQVVQATVSAPNQLMLKVAFDAANALLPLDAAAAQGVGWSIVAPDGTVITGGAAALAVGSPDTLYVSFNGLIPQGGKLHYGYGYGRLAAADGSGFGHAVYDNARMPIWVDAKGLDITGAAAVVAPVVSSGSVLDVGAAGGTWTGTAAAENWVLHPDSGGAVIYGFDVAADTLTFSGIAPNHLIYWDPAGIGIPGVGITWTGGGGGVILAGLSEVPQRDLVFA